MAEEIARLGIEVLSGDIVKATKRLDKLEKQSKQNTKENKKLTKSFSGMGAAIGSLGLGLAFKSIIGLAVEQERVTRQLDAAIKSTGGSAGFTTKELEKMAAGFQEVTNFSDESILGMQSLLLTFTNLKDDVLPRTTEAVLNLSERMGTDLQSSALQLAKALNDPVANLGSLSRAGIQFSKEQKATIKTLWETNRAAEAQDVILKELEVQFGGSAKAARDTFGGAIKSLGNAFGDLLEGDGGNLNDAKFATEDLIKILQDPGTKAAFSGLVTGVISVTTALIEGVVALNEFGTSLGVFLAGGEATQTLAEVDEKIVNIGITLERLQKGKEAASERGIIGDLFLGSEGEFDKNIEKATKQLIDLAELRGRLDKEEPEKATGALDVTDDTEVMKTSPLGMTEEELNAEFDRMSEHTDLMIEKFAEDDERKLAQRRDYHERLFNMEAGSLQAGADFAKAVRDGDLKGQINNGSLMLANLSKTNKAAFEVQKAFSLAKAIATLPSAVIDSFNNGGGYPWGLIPAALMAATGIQQINAIKSASFGGGGSVPSVSGGSTSPAVPTVSGLPPGSTATPEGTEQPTVRELRVTVEGDGPNSEGMRKFAQNLAETIEDMGGAGRLVLS